jgi:hypothetical protein
MHQILAANRRMRQAAAIASAAPRGRFHRPIPDRGKPQSISVVGPVLGHSHRRAKFETGISGNLADSAPIPRPFPIRIAKSAGGGYRRKLPADPWGVAKW